MRYLSFLILILIAFPALSQERRQLKYPSRETPAVRRESTQTPGRNLTTRRGEDLPAELVIVAPEASRRPVVSRRVPNDPFEAVYREAERAAQNTATDLAQSFGFREYYKVGFYQALHRVVERPSASSPDYAQGRQQARSSFEFRRDGEMLGRRAADDHALQAAERSVSEQFYDLGREPIRNPVVGRFDSPDFLNSFGSYAEPELQEIFQNMPLSGFSSWRGRTLVFYEGWRPDPWSLYAFNSYRDCYDDRWRDPEFAFRYFSGDRRASTYYRSLNQESRDAYAGRFRLVYRDALAPLFERVNRTAYNDGWSDGWAYGSAVCAEWHFRAGYQAGALEAQNYAAEDAYARQYPGSYRDFYNQAFDAWNNKTVPGLEDLHFEDANHDGVFQPGELISLHYTAVNFGGRAGRLELSLTGVPLQRTAHQMLDLPSRNRTRVSAQLSAKLDMGARAKTTYAMDVQLGDAHQMVNLPVFFPLILQNDVTVLKRDNLSGDVELRVRMSNQSSQPVHGASLRWSKDRLDLGTLNAGETHEERIIINRQDPLDMIEGKVDLLFDLEVEGRRWDRLDYHISDQVEDLDNDDLLHYLLDQARAAQGSRTGVKRAQDLFLRRMEADWRAVVAARGNPYKDDLRSRDGARTELGKLVEAYKAERPRMVHPEVITGMRQSLLAMSERLPGSHPFLRKQYRALVDQL